MNKTQGEIGRFATLHSVMPYANTHILIRLLGHFGTAAVADENWSVGFRFAIVGADVPSSSSALQTFTDACATAAQTFHASAGAGAGSNCYLDAATGARIGPDGKYNPATQDTIRKDLTPVAGSGTGLYPWNTALVISLRTARPRGYCSNGRIYYPMLSLGLQSGSGRLTTSLVGSRLTPFVTMVNAMNAAAGIYATNMKLAVLSSVGGGMAALVTAVRSDTRLDSIERREAKAAPAWTTQAVA